MELKISRAEDQLSERASIANNVVVRRVALAEFKQFEHRPRKHSDRQIAKIMNSIREFGFVVPVLVDRELRIVAGEASVEAARRLKIVAVPTICVEHLTEAQIRALRVALNKLPEMAEWDFAELKLEFDVILELDGSFELELTAFETAEIDSVFDLRASTEKDDPADDADMAPANWAVSRLGDIWKLGSHKLLCGDAKSSESYVRLLDDEQPALVATDAPYNTKIGGQVGGLGRIKHREFFEASGEMSDAEFRAFLRASFASMAAPLKDGGLFYAFMDWRNIELLLSVGRELNLALINLCVWAKPNGGMGSFYRSAHELCCVFKKGRAPHTNNVELGKHGRYRTNVWNYAGVNSFGRSRMDDLAVHPTVKSTAMIVDMMKDASRRGDIVVDGFCGSGTTLIAAEKCGRAARCIEIDPLYVDVAIRRFHKRFGIDAVHIATGLTFQEVQRRREEENEAPAAATPASHLHPRIPRRPPPKTQSNNSNRVLKGDRR